MLLDARGLQLSTNLTCKNIVAYDVILTVMLVETATLAVIDEIVLDANTRRALVGVESPAAVIE